MCRALHSLELLWQWTPSCTHTSPVEEVLHDGHEGGHLTEDEHAVVGSSKLWQHPVKNLKLSRSSV